MECQLCSVDIEGYSEKHIVSGVQCVGHSVWGTVCGVKYSVWGTVCGVQCVGQSEWGTVFWIKRVGYSVWGKLSGGTMSWVQ